MSWHQPKHQSIQHLPKLKTRRFWCACQLELREVSGSAHRFGDYGTPPQNYTLACGSKEVEAR